MAAETYADSSAAYSNGYVPEAGPSTPNGFHTGATSVSGSTTQLNGSLGAIKMEDEEDRKHDIHDSDSYSEKQGQKPGIKAEGASPRAEVAKTEPDIASFLNFETEDDKKVKLEHDGPSGNNSRDQSPDLKDDEDEEDEKASRRPGEPVSIAHLPNAEKEVG